MATTSGGVGSVMRLGVSGAAAGPPTGTAVVIIISVTLFRTHASHF